MAATSAKSDEISARLVIRASRTNDFIDAEVREYRRREDELRQQAQIAAAAAPASTSSTDVAPNSAMSVTNAVASCKESLGEQERSKYATASTTSTRAVVRPSRSLERRQTATMMRRWASLRLSRELLYERQRELELLQQGRIDTTSDQRRITLT